MFVLREEAEARGNMRRGLKSGWLQRAIDDSATNLPPPLLPLLHFSLPLFPLLLLPQPLLFLLLSRSLQLDLRIFTFSVRAEWEVPGVGQGTNKLAAAAK
jgi:hypothetical protein